MNWNRPGLFVFQLVLAFFLSNLLISHLILRKDISSSNRLTISEQTNSLLTSIRRPLSVDAFYSSDLPPEYNVRRDLIREYLNEIAGRNPEYIKIVFHDPDASAEIRKKANDMGLSPNEIRKSSETSQSFQEVYMGIAVHYDSETEILSDYFFVEEAESQFVRALRKLSQKNKEPSLAISIDPGVFSFPEPGDGSGKDTWGVFYHQALVKEYGNPALVRLNDAKIPDSIRLLFVIGSPEWTGKGKLHLEEFLARGGRMIFLASSMQFKIEPVRNKNGLSFEKGSQATPNAGLGFWNDLLIHYGITVGTDLIFDFEHPVPVANGADHSGWSSKTQYYPLWQFLYKNSGNLHESNFLTDKTEFLILPWSSGIRIDPTKQPNIKYEVLIKSDLEAIRKENLFSVSQNQNFLDRSLEASRVPMGVLLEGKLNPLDSRIKSALPTKMIFFASPYFVSDILALPEFRTYLREANVPFLLNSIDYLLDENQYLITRKQSPAVLPLRAFSQKERNLYTFFNLAFIPGIIVIFAVRRIKRRNSGR
ncbi:GldG family protein [Leptospira idonii]|uniref:Uncharacterized protein n=1 Tax=Leptospira idonii TaxID=1193500 RepID=A0A4R9M2H6_9LEPT|nr:GldG family protein [Leptospira idonii]TGN20984.1 hypothetical protein EHS15_00220 [Leptospira idonii]